MVLADTVGFIRELPHELVAAFQSTLQEAREAHLLLHVVDASDPRRDEHIQQVDTVLDEIGAGDDSAAARLQQDRSARVGAEARAQTREGRPCAVWICASAAQTGLELLREAIAERLDLNVQRLWMHLPPARRGDASAAVCGAAWCATSARSRTARLELLVELPAAELAAWAARPGVQLLEAQPRVRQAACAAPRAVPRIGRGRAGRAGALLKRTYPAAPTALPIWHGISPAKTRQRPPPRGAPDDSVAR